MKLEHRIEKAAAVKDASRPYLQQPHFDGKRVIATDGRIIAIVRPQDSKGDSAGAVPIEALKLARKSKSPATITLNGSCEVEHSGGKASMHRPDNAWPMNASKLERDPQRAP